MPPKTLLGFMILVVFVLPVFGLRTPSSVNAEMLLQEATRLDGYTIYFSESLNEPSRFDRSDGGISRLGGLLQNLGAELRTVDWNINIPDEIDLIVIPGPEADLSGEQVARLWNYLRNGGRVLLLVDPLSVDQRNGQLRLNQVFSSQDRLFELTWKDLGIDVRDDIVVIEGETRTVFPPPIGRIREDDPTPTPRPPVESPILFTEFLASTIDTEHPATQNIDGEVMFFGSRSIVVDNTIQPFETIPLVFSDVNYYGETDYAVYLRDEVAEYNVGDDFSRGPLALVAAVQNPIDNMRMVIIGDGDFITNGKGFSSSPSFSAGFIYPQNVRMTLSIITWLLEADEANTVPLNFPTPGPTATPTTTPTMTPTETPESTGTPEGGS